ncbi:uncharacterized protein LOC127808597 [Diospyros lotus]|uniref:uncharacterized protein LOC127808597 n=1 Tax=Diospyros lotus TaxID=55363 RepID=UPI0022523921|nr:uncharacterized protein LOC127808597 [Diospyros lotus]
MTFVVSMDLIHGFGTLNSSSSESPSTFSSSFLITKLPKYSWPVKLVARIMLLAMVFAALIPRLGFGISSPSDEINYYNSPPSSWAEVRFIDRINLLAQLPLLFQDLANEGLLKKVGGRALFVADEQLQVHDNIEMDFIANSDLERQSAIPDETYDFAFTRAFLPAAEFIDRTLKVGGLATFQLGEDPNLAFHKPPNYKIVYLRRLGTTIIAMRKTSHAKNSPARKRLCGVSFSLPEAKKEALNKLEDVLLEPPRAALGKSKRFLTRTRYLPDLMGDSLEEYPRRVFIDVGLPENDGAASDGGWFSKHYPRRNMDFEMYRMVTVMEEEESPSKVAPETVGMSDWLKRNVREEEYVVMKAEAEVVEEMVKNKVIGLVDELFMECKHGVGLRRKRAYWECLALYGRLRDEGVAVHQWWG